MTPAPTFDLQSHSTRSDGELPPAAVVAAAAAAGVELLALTDHDTVDGVDEALDAARRPGVRVVPAVELSALDGTLDVHILGYGIDHASPALAADLAAWRADRARRVDRMADLLAAEGFVVDRTDLDARRAAGDAAGRPHLATAVLGQAANARLLSERGIAPGDRSAFFAAFLVAGTPTYVPRETPTVADAVAAIHAAGGVAVWAHPFWDVADPDEAIAKLERFAALGIDGVEAFYAEHTCAEARLLDDRATALGLLTTGSADFHGPGHEIFNRFRAFDLCGREPRLGPIGEV